MNTQTKFGASARHEMTAYAPFRVGDYELHVFKAPVAAQKAVSATHIQFAHTGPVLGAGLERDEAALFKGPEERASDARYAAEHSGNDICVVAYDLNTDVQPIRIDAAHTATTKVLKLGAYEAHVHYPVGCAYKTLAVENLQIFDACSMIGTEDRELDNTMDSDDRSVKASMIFSGMKKNGAAKAVAFFVGRLGEDRMLNATALTNVINHAAGTPTLEEQMASMANTKLMQKPASTSWVKRVLGASASPHAA